MKNEPKSKKKHPILRSLCQSFLLVIVLVGLLLIIDFFDENGFVSQDSIFTTLLFVTGIVGSVLIFKKNYTNRSYMKLFIPIAIVIIAISGISIFSYESIRFDKFKASICGRDGQLYYCASDEPITCDDGNYAVHDGAGYKCISSDEYRHDVLHKEYDYTCISKYEKEDIQQNEVTSLMLEEKSCLESKIESTFKELVDSKKQGMESKYDIRDKVHVTAGNQGSSDTCEIWSSTKALEISAQLKGMNYQFLLDFEKKINSLNPNINGIINEDDNTITLGSDHLIPGKKKYYVFDYYGAPVADGFEYILVYSSELLKLIDNYQKILFQVYYYKNGFYIFDDLSIADEYDRELTNLYAKELVMKYGSAYIKTDYEINPGHRMIIIGWDDSKEAWLVLNSWGKSWPKDEYVPTSNGDGTVWIKYSDKNFVVGSANYGGDAIELISE